MVLTERRAHFADHGTRGQHIFVQGTRVTFPQTDAEGLVWKKIIVMAHFVELLGRPITRQMAETMVEEATAVHVLPVPHLEEGMPF